MSFTFQNPFAYFNNPLNSNPVGLGNLYIGLPDTDPETPANQVQVYAVQPDGSELAIPQPVRLLTGGVPSYNGTPVQIKTNAISCSVKISSMIGAQIYYTARFSTPGAELEAALADGSANIAGIEAGKLPNSVRLLAAMLSSAPDSGEQAIIVEQDGVGGLFYWDAPSTEAADNVIVYEVSGVATGRWKRQWNGESITARWAGAVADSASGDLFSGTDNSPAQLLADEAGLKYNVEVVWPCGRYRFTQPFQRKTVHSGINFQYIGAKTVFIFDNAAPTTWLTGKGHGSDSQRSNDIKRIAFFSAQNRIHKLFDSNVYRGLYEDLTVDGFDVGFDIDCVYAWFKRCNFSNNNRTIDPRALRVSGDYSTMLNCEECVFLGNNVGFEFRDRNLGSNDTNDNFLALQFTRCGFELNTTDGLKIDKRVWYLKTDGCWSEGHSGFGVNVTANAANTDWIDLACRWDDDVNLPSDRYYQNQLGTIREYCAKRINYRGTQEIISPKSGMVLVNASGAIRTATTNVPCTAAIQANNVLRLTFQTVGSTIVRPIIKCTPMKRNVLLSVAYSVDNTVSVPAIADNAIISRCDIFCYEPATPAVGVIPDWWMIEVSWPSVDNIAV